MHRLMLFFQPLAAFQQTLARVNTRNLEHSLVNRSSSPGHLKTMDSRLYAVVTSLGPSVLARAPH